MLDLSFYSFAYKVTTVFTSLAIIYMGYRLFSRGVFGDAGDVEATWGDNKLLLKKASPGTIFVVFGAALLLSVVSEGFNSKSVTVAVRDAPALGGSASKEASMQGVIGSSNESPSDTRPVATGDDVVAERIEGQSSLQPAVPALLDQNSSPLGLGIDPLGLRCGAAKECVFTFDSFEAFLPPDDQEAADMKPEFNPSPDG